MAITYFRLKSLIEGLIPIAAKKVKDFLCFQFKRRDSTQGFGQRGVRKIEGLGDCMIGYLTVHHIDPFG